MQIDHDPEEPKRDPDKSLWPWVFLMACAASAAIWFTEGLDWKSVLAGAVMAFAASFWAVDYLRYDFFKSWRDTGRDRRP